MTAPVFSKVGAVIYNWMGRVSRKRSALLADENDGERLLRLLREPRNAASMFDIKDKELTAVLSEWIKELRKGFVSFVPKRLDPQINQWVSCYANRLVGFVTEELIRRGTLETPKNESSLTDGVFYIKGEYVKNI